MLHSVAFETLMRASRNLKSLHRFRMNSVLNQTTKIQVMVQNENYIIETVTKTKELFRLLKYRSDHEGFSNDLRLSIPSFTFTDTFDSHAEHILIRDLRSGTIVGGFRLLSSAYAPIFSNDFRFSLNQIKTFTNRILEVSKLFVQPQHKHQDLVALSAQFISEYMLKSRDEILIGTQSINSDSFKSAGLVYRYLQSLQKTNTQYPCSPRQAFQVPNFEHWATHFKDCLSSNEQSESLSLLSPTFKETLSLGATISGAPALDRHTNRIDFLTILAKEDLNRALWKKSPCYTESLSEYSYS